MRTHFANTCADSFLFNAYCIFGNSAGSLSLLQLVIVMVLDCCVYLTYGLVQCLYARLGRASLEMLL